MKRTSEIAACCREPLRPVGIAQIVWLRCRDVVKAIEAVGSGGGETSKPVVIDDSGVVEDDGERKAGDGIPTPPSPLFLGRYTPVLRRFPAVPLRCPASWRRDGENGRKMAENGRNLGEKRARNSGG